MMNNRSHLPAGQMQGGVPDMGPGSGGNRRGGRPQHYPNSHHYPHHSVGQPVYPSGYMSPYAAGASPYYVPPHYQNGAMGTPAYLPYPPNPVPYGRSPPTIPQPHYVPMVPQNPYSRPPQSPIVASPYQAPPPPVPVSVPMIPHTPSSTHSHAAPPPLTPPVASTAQAPPQVPIEVLPGMVEVQQPPLDLREAQTSFEQTAQSSQSSYMQTVLQPQTPEFVVPDRVGFRPPLPWFSVPDSTFPVRAARSKRRRRALGVGFALERPEVQQTSETSAAHETQPAAPPATKEDAEQQTETKTEPSDDQPPAKAASDEASARPETPSTQDQADDTPSTSATTPSSANLPESNSSITVSSTLTKPALRSAVPAVPAVPAALPGKVLPALPKSNSKDTKAKDTSFKSAVSNDASSKGAKAASSTGNTDTKSKSTDGSATLVGDSDLETAHNADGTVEEAPSESAQPSGPVKPQTWAKLFDKPATSAGNATATVAATHAHTNGNAVAGAANAVTGAPGGFAQSSASTIAEALQAYHAGVVEKLAFLEPRGLVNTGNMCYMNSVLQVLIFCAPFFDFLDQVSKKKAHSFKSDTPLLDAMVNFMGEFKVIDSATTVDQLKRRLKSEDLEKYDEAFTPEFVYDAIRNLPRFAAMKRGHQQDAQEFLGFLLEGLHDECAKVIRAAPLSNASTAPNSSLPSPTMSSKGTDDAWLEVGPRQRAAITRSSGDSAISSPITKIFGGHLRSELRVPGLKTSVMLESYQSLQLDIGSAEIRNVIDALKWITRPETIHGDFKSPRGPGANTTKQVYIESLPPVLILHLKRFHYDAGTDATIKIWKKVGYPLELEIPQEVLARPLRNSINQDGKGLPRYRLTAVVYHHGKNANDGHYTVDVRRQDGQEWIRIDDTRIRRVRSEDVAEGGAEDNTKSAQADGRKDDNNAASGNRFAGINDEDTGDDDGWKQSTSGNKKWSSIANGASSAATNGPKNKQHKEGVKDNKVAYLLFYQRI